MIVLAAVIRLVSALFSPALLATEPGPADAAVAGYSGSHCVRQVI